MRLHKDAKARCEEGAISSAKGSIFARIARGKENQAEIIALKELLLHDEHNITRFTGFRVHRAY